MPSSQVAHIDHFDFGAPVTEAIVKEWKVRADDGGTVYFRFENAEGDSDGIVTIQVAPDHATDQGPGTYVDTSVAGNGVAVANETIAMKVAKDFTISLRRGQDTHVAIQASGGCRMNAQIRHGGLLEELNTSVTTTEVS
jgi:hypothetical protein